ncbi:putative 2OG-Fe(II) oxygenase [Roseibium algae]|uniref:2OG-Fe(II) oxygenase n=1 Tax=Roseibium algae TaxID=3123038 RepID=A0ABU8TJX2_9HYPH
MEQDIQIDTIYPRFVMRKRFPELAPGFNEQLMELAIADAMANRVPAGGHDRSIGEDVTHLAHLRHNFLDDARDPVVAQFIKMVDHTVREYLSAVYHYDHEGEIDMMSDTFWQNREEGQNVGINCHTHFKSDLVATYYLNTGCEPGEDNPLRQGALRFYDPQNLGVRPWPNRNPGLVQNGWYNIVPEPGMMVVFEGHIPHDSTYFGGEQRLCIPVMCDVKTSRSHIKKPVSELLRNQG